MKVSEFDYDLPAELIAQRAVEPRDHARLMVLRRDTRSIEHRHFYDLPEFLRPGDVLVVNDTRVMPYRVTGRRKTGGKLEGLLIEKPGADTWRAMFKSRGRLQPGERILLLEDRLEAELISRDEESVCTLRLLTPHAEEIVLQFGLAPLPPYIKRTTPDAGLDDYDRERYQTTYARSPGAIAAPTAGMHFTDELLGRIRSAGVELVTVTLHVGLGTFQPVRVDQVEQHRMHTEGFELSKGAAGTINHALDQRRRIIAVGTTSVRVLEHTFEDGHVRPGSGSTDIFIYPPYAFQAVSALVTNFHLPRSTLLMLVSAFADRDFLMDAYHVAVSERYRFYSYGDAMLIL